MKNTISEYNRGIASFHNLMGMLHSALIEVMPSAELAKVGAYGWRGYIIRKYEILACGHYFCQIYSDSPTVLLMEEFYNYSGFFYPWRVDLDLMSSGFFSMNVNEQKNLLVKFYREAVQEAIEWQTSDKRLSIVPERILNGKSYSTRSNLILPKSVYPVTPSYISMLEQQNNLLSILKRIIEKQSADLKIPKPYIQYNITGWKYRGFWLKPRKDEPEDVIPPGPFPYHFKIDLSDNPLWLRYVDHEEELILDLGEHYYFSLDDKNKEKTLVKFVSPIMKKISQDL